MAPPLRWMTLITAMIQSALVTVTISGGNAEDSPVKFSRATLHACSGLVDLRGPAWEANVTVLTMSQLSLRDVNESTR